MKREQKLKRQPDSTAKARFAQIIELANEMEESKMIALCRFATERQFNKWVKSQAV